MSLCVCVCHCLCPEAKISQQNAVNYACVPAELTGTEPPHACMCVCVSVSSQSVCARVTDEQTSQQTSVCEVCPQTESS